MSSRCDRLVVTARVMSVCVAAKSICRSGVDPIVNARMLPESLSSTSTVKKKREGTENGSRKLV